METPPLAAAQRIARLIEHLGISSYQFGKETGLSHQTISNVLTGKNKPSLDTLEAIATRYPKTATWLLTGAGELYTDEQKPVPSIQPGGTPNNFGGTAHAPGALDALYANLEDVQGYKPPMAGVAPVAVPQNDREMIALLVSRISDKQKQITILNEENGKLHGIIKEQQHTVRFLQDQVITLQAQGKLPGNHVPSETYAAAPDTRPVVMGLRRYDALPTARLRVWPRRRRTGKLRPLFGEPRMLVLNLAA